MAWPWQPILVSKTEDRNQENASVPLKSDIFETNIFQLEHKNDNV